MIHTLTVQYGHVVNVQAESEIQRAVALLPHRRVFRDRNCLRLIEWDFDNGGDAAGALARLPKYPGFTYFVGDAKISWEESEIPQPFAAPIAPPTPAEFDLAPPTPAEFDLAPAQGQGLDAAGGALPLFLLK